MAVTRPGLGPTLPGALRERFGIPPGGDRGGRGRAVAAAVAAILVALTRPTSAGEQVVHKGPPVFNMLYPPEAMREAGPLRRAAALEGRRGGLEVSVVVRGWSCRASTATSPTACCRSTRTASWTPPSADAGPAARPRRAARGSTTASATRSATSASPADERFTGREVLLVPDDPEEGEGRGAAEPVPRKASGEKLTPPERNLAYLARKAYRSFRFGTERG